MLLEIAQTFLATCRDVFPVLALIVGFQYIILRQPIPRLPQMAVGFVCVLIGLTLFLVGLEKALFPLGKIMAKQLSAPEFVFGKEVVPDNPGWRAYTWVYVFAALIGFATTIAEPALIAVAHKAHQVSGGTISQWGLRLVVALGVAMGIALGTFRIITGTPLFLYIAAGYLVVVVQTIFAPKAIIPLAYDSGGVTTSTVTVPLVAALGLGLSATIPGRNPALDGFGLIAFASLFPIITVMGYAQVTRWWGGIYGKFTRER
ncbi:MAG: DUF1538 domain-containing protein [Deltaproteobacteria bacterium]|nr:DUF1538 domain-containing protein [Deltaproteobacteria bacterium]MBW2111845.1 DUF1538 domain-containing protein [Deltaproteobacteria bacterium]